MPYNLTYMGTLNNKTTNQIHRYREQTVAARSRGWEKQIKVVKRYELPILK